MKSTGMIRRIDELGRIVIPKEIRSTMGITEGSPLEITINGDGQILLCLHNMMARINDYAQDFCEIANSILDLPVIICDRYTVVALSGCSKKMYLNKAISPSLIRLMDNHSNYISSVQDGTQMIKLIEDEEDTYVSQVIYPIMSDNNCQGMVICASNNASIDISKCNIIKLIASYLSKQLGM